ncbi:MAG: response regulator [Candidatus Omnitrophica bacterium]|nr:response regulator [Candidatus Omnitrophota bacterium]MDD5488968.1 response regulator [Candidatus Omnitrophota bacterium]
MRKNKKIVIADDNVELCGFMKDILSDEGHEVDMVHNGYQLLAYLENNSPEVIILDLMMPEKDGLSIISTIKQMSPYARIVIYTGYQEYEKSIYARAVDRFLVKGGDIDTLVNTVGEL